MANGPIHRLTAATVVGGTLALAEVRARESSFKPLVGAGLAALLTNLPDRLEPPTHPNHRQFFHSIACEAAVGTLAYSLCAWKPPEHWKKALRFVLLAGCGAYAVHLVLDAATPKSLPLLGRI